MNQTAEKTSIKISPVDMKNRASVGIHAGDTVRVWQKIEEKEKIRLQAFEGLVLARKHGEEPGATFTVRRVSDGVGVEKIFPLYSPMIDRIEIVRRSKVRRAKLYHIREKVAREIKHQMRKMKIVGLTTESDIFQKAEASDKKEKAETASQQINTVNGEEKTAVNAQEEKQAPVVEAEEKKE